MSPCIVCGRYVSTCRCADHQRILSVGDVQRHLRQFEWGRHGNCRSLRPDASRPMSSGRLLRWMLRWRTWVRRTALFRSNRMHYFGAWCWAVPSSTMPKRSGRLLWGSISMRYRWARWYCIIRYRWAHVSVNYWCANARYRTTNNWSEAKSSNYTSLTALQLAYFYTIFQRYSKNCPWFWFN